MLLLNIMNPFKGTLNRLGFLLWSVVCISILLGFGWLIDATKVGHSGVYWLGLRCLFIAAWVALAFLVLARRLQNASYNPWFCILWLVPGFGFLFWVALLFIPPKR